MKTNELIGKLRSHSKSIHAIVKRMQELSNNDLVGVESEQPSNNCDTAFQQEPFGFDSGPPRFDSGPPRFDSGPPKFDSGPPKFDSGPPRFDSGPPRR